MLFLPKYAVCSLLCSSPLLLVLGAGFMTLLSMLGTTPAVVLEVAKGEGLGLCTLYAFSIKNFVFYLIWTLELSKLEFRDYLLESPPSYC
jgi:hypothetical protein